MRPAFLITIDTEADGQWGSPATTTTQNARWIPRFQTECERRGFKPVYLTDYSMARSTDFLAFAHDVLRRSAGEIGAHLHPWSTPPIRHLTQDDNQCHPYVTEYPAALIGEKLQTLTRLLEDVFQVKIASHRAGRWGFDGVYAQALLQHGYRVDCSVTPGVSWKTSPGRPGGPGGPDYAGFLQEPYFLDPLDIRRPGASTLLEVPVTILAVGSPVLDWLRAIRRRARFSRSLTWLRPNGRNLRAMLRVLDRALAEGRTCVEFMLHSSELMPGGSPNFSDHSSIEALYRDLNALFDAAARSFRASTLAEFAMEFARGRAGGHPS